MCVRLSDFGDEKEKEKKRTQIYFLRGKEFSIFNSLKNPSRKRIPRLSLSLTYCYEHHFLTLFVERGKQQQIETEKEGGNKSLIRERKGFRGISFPRTIIKKSNKKKKKR